MAFVEVVNAHDETNLAQGDPIANPVRRLEHNGSCRSNRATDLAMKLAALPGQTVFLSVVSTDLIWSQSANVRVWL